MMRTVLTLGVVLWTNAALAQTRLSESVSGPHAFGLGGAFTAVSDDASAAVINPAGISLVTTGGTDSTTTLVSREVVYHDASGHDINSTTSGLTTFLGASLRLSPETAIAGYLSTPLASTRDQQYDEDFGGLDGFHQTHDRIRYDFQYTEAGAGLGYQRSPGASRFGIGVAAFRYRQGGVSSLIINVDPTIDNASSGDPTTQPLRILVASVSRATFEMLGAKLVFGWMDNFGSRLTWAASASLARAIQIRSRSSSAVVAVPLDADGHPIPITNALAATRYDSKNTSKNQPWPATIRSGMSYQATSSTSLSSDVILSTPATYRVNDDATRSMAQWNAALGVDFHPAGDWTWRAGLFTDRDTNPDPEDVPPPSDAAQMHYMGESLQCELAFGHTMIALGVMMQQGKGKGVAISRSVQKTTGTMHAESLSISSTF